MATIPPFSDFSYYEVKAKRPGPGSFYRAVADSVRARKEHQLVKRQVLSHVLYVLSNPKHPQHTIYEGTGAKCQEKGKPLFTCLDCPELFANAQVYYVVSKALNIRLTIWRSFLDGKPKDCEWIGGPVSLPECHILVRRTGGIATYSSLVRDHSGIDLLDFFNENIKSQDVRDTEEVPTRDFSCSWDKSLEVGATIGQGPTRLKNIIYYNPLDSSVQRGSLDRIRLEKRRTFKAFGHSVERPEQVARAVETMLEAVARAPTQGISIRTTSNPESHKTFKPFVGIDGEFKSLPACYTGDMETLLIEDKAEMFLNILQINVGVYGQFNYHILHMIENFADSVVEGLTPLLDFLFSPEIAKVFFNPAEDIHVINCTVAHLFQGTSRDAYTYKSYRPINGRSEHEVTPSWKFTGQNFQGERPARFIFPRVPTPCSFHTEETDRGLACPCNTGNYDISRVVDCICRNIEMSAARGKANWAKPAYGYNYANFLTAVLQGHKFLSLFVHWKDVPNAFASRGMSKTDFYNSMGPRTQWMNEYFGYGLGDVAAIVYVIQFLLFTSDRVRLACCLFNHCSAGEAATLTLPSNSSTEVESRRFDATWRRRISSHWSVEECRDDLKPRYLSEYRSFGDTQRPSCVRVPADRTANSNAPQSLKLRTHSYVSHEIYRRLCQESWDEVQNALGSCLVHKPIQLFTWVSSEDVVRINKARSILWQLAFDPCGFAWPDELGCVAPAANACSKDNRRWDIHPDPIVRSGQSYEECFISFLKSKSGSMSSPPRGFGAPVNHCDGLPGSVSRVPGEDMPLAREIYEAYPQPGLYDGKHLGPRVDEPCRPQPSPVRTAVGILPRSISLIPKWDKDQTHAMNSFMFNSWASDARQELRDIENEIRNEWARNEDEGEPAEFDASDIDDPNGRKFWARVQTTPDWNKPAYRRQIKTRDGSGNWVSYATKQADAIKQALADTVEGWNFPKKKADRTKSRPRSWALPKVQAKASVDKCFSRAAPESYQAPTLPVPRGPKIAMRKEWPLVDGQETSRPAQTGAKSWADIAKL